MIGSFLQFLFLLKNHSVNIAGRIRNPNGLATVPKPDNIPAKIHFSFRAVYRERLKINKNRDSVYGALKK